MTTKDEAVADTRSKSMQLAHDILDSVGGGDWNAACYARAERMIKTHVAASLEQMREALEEVLATGLNGGNNVRLALLAASQKAVSEKGLAKAEASERAVVKACLALAAYAAMKGGG